MKDIDLNNIDFGYLSDTSVQLNHYADIYEKGLELIKNEPRPRELLVKILDEYSKRFRQMPNFDSSILENDEVDDELKEQLKSLVLFGTQAALIKENSTYQKELKDVNGSYKDLLSIITHEFKNSLTSIYGYNRILKKRVEEGRTNQVEEITSNVDKLTKKMFNLIDTLVNMSLIEQNKLEAQSNKYLLIEHVIQPVVEEIQYQLNVKEMAIEVFSNEDEVTLEGDAALINVAFANLLINAIQYGYKQTDIEIRIELVDAHVIVEIFNKGNGIEEEHLHKIFDKFSRFHTKYKQTNVGVGLFTVKHIIELHNGTIHAESQKDKWMRFVIKLPLT